MNAWVTRGLRTALLTGGLLAVGTGIAAADENDLTVEGTGVTATVPVDDAATLDLPVVTGTGQDLSVTGQDGSALTVPVDTNTGSGTTVQLGDVAQDAPAASVPVRVLEADGTPAPDGSLAVTVPINTSGGTSAAGTTVTTSVVDGNAGDLLDGGVLTGTDVSVDLDGPVVLGAPADGGGSVDVAPDPLVTIGDTEPGGTREALVSVPVSGESGAPSVVSLPGDPGSDGSPVPADGNPLSDNTVVVVVGRLVTDAPDGPGDGSSGADDPTLTVPVDLGGALPGIGGDLAGTSPLSGNTVVIDLADVLSLPGSANNPPGTVVTVPVDQGRDGLLGDNVLEVRLPVRLLAPVDEDGTGNGGPRVGGGRGVGSGPAPGTGGGTGTGSGTGTGTDEGTGSAGYGTEGTESRSTERMMLCSDGSDGSDGSDRTSGGATAGDGNGAGNAVGTGTTGHRAGSGSGGDACGIGLAATSRPAPSTGSAGLGSLALAGLAALVTAVLLATARRRRPLIRG